MDHVYLSIFYLIFVTACTSGDKDAAIQRELADKTFPTTSYNYTSYDLRIIKFEQVTLPFKIDEAPDGGSITSNRLSEEKLDNGETVRFMSHNCCFIWETPLDQTLRIRVVWHLVFDSIYYDGRAKISYNDRTSPELVGAKQLRIFSPQQGRSGPTLWYSIS